PPTPRTHSLHDALPIFAAGDVVEDHGVEALAAQLLAGALHAAVAMLGREAHQHLGGAALLGQRRQHVVCRGELQREGLATLLLRSEEHTSELQSLAYLV